MQYPRWKLKAMFRQYWNDYLTIQNFADAYGVSKEFMTRAINIGRKLHNEQADEYRMEQFLSGSDCI